MQKLTVKTLNKIILNGGASVRKNGKLANIKKGYQVSIYDCCKLKLNEHKKILNTANKILTTLKAGEFLGFWVDNGLLYLDISKTFLTYQAGYVFGKIYNQLAIYDNANKKNITL